MKQIQFTEHENKFLKTKNYEIKVNELNAFEIAECFKSQYPKEIGVIVFGEQVDSKINIGLLFVGINLGKFRKWLQK